MQILEGTLDETEVTRYKNMSRPVMLGLNVLSSLFISTNGNNTQLQLDGSKIFAWKRGYISEVFSYQNQRL